MCSCVITYRSTTPPVRSAMSLTTSVKTSSSIRKQVSDVDQQRPRGLGAVVIPFRDGDQQRVPEQHVVGPHDEFGHHGTFFTGGEGWGSIG